VININIENELLEIPVISDQRGSLISIEALKSIPFKIKRVYYLYNLKNEKPRGFHAHKTLEQVLICVNGSCKITLNYGRHKKEYSLTKPNQMLYIGNFVWREMHDFSDDCVLLVLASEHYDETDYIRNYDTFIKNKVGIEFVTFNSDFLKASATWLSDAEIQNLIMAPPFNRLKQIEWYNSLIRKDDYYIKGIVYKGVKIGATGLKNINKDTAEYWGYIGEKRYWSKGLGKFLISHCISHSKKLKLRYVYLIVTAENERAIKLYEKHQFVKVHRDDGKILMVRKL
jgi:RimJ/RimL family protein N-acetyltransferase